METSDRRAQPRRQHTAKTARSRPWQEALARVNAIDPDAARMWQQMVKDLRRECAQARIDLRAARQEISSLEAQLGGIEANK